MEFSTAGPSIPRQRIRFWPCVYHRHSTDTETDRQRLLDNSANQDPGQHRPRDDHYQFDHGRFGSLHRILYRRSPHDVGPLSLLWYRRTQCTRALDLDGGHFKHHSRNAIPFTLGIKAKLRLSRRLCLSIFGRLDRKGNGTNRAWVCAQYAARNRRVLAELD